MLPIKIIDGNLNYETTVTWELKNTHSSCPLQSLRMCITFINHQKNVAAFNDKHHDKHRKCPLLHSIIQNLQISRSRQKKKKNTRIYKSKIINTCRRIQYKRKLCQSSMDSMDSSSLKLILRIIELVDYTFLDLLLVLTLPFQVQEPHMKVIGLYMQAVTYDISCSSIESI